MTQPDVATSQTGEPAASSTSTVASGHTATPAAAPAIVSSTPAVAPSAEHHKSHVWRWIVAVIVLGVAAVFGIPWLIETLSTVSTDDAYVSGHMTFVAPRVAGQVARVLVDDNNRVRKGDLLVQLDKEPFQVQLDIAQSAVDSAQADLVAAHAQVRANEGLTRSLRYSLERAIEDVDNQIALLNSKFASLQSKKATVAKAQADYDRIAGLVQTGAATKQQLDAYTESLAVAKAQLAEAQQGVYQVRASLGLPPQTEKEEDLIKVPDDLDQTFSAVREAQAKLIQAASQLGVIDSFDKSPKQMVADFYKRDPQGDINRIYAEIAKNAPLVKQAESKLAQAQRNLDQAKLNLRYCDIVAEIDGAVIRRNVNPGNNVVVGQSLMAVRSLTEIWVDANFKETQLAELRIGQPVDLEVDMYGSKQKFRGRISGFAMGTGSTLALLPAENATGNFVKVVQRLPVRIDVLDYDPEKLPLFAGLSVVPVVHINEAPTGPGAGGLLQPYQAATASQQTTPSETKP